jgi:molybdopterin converting factor subunit 1
MINVPPPDPTRVTVHFFAIARERVGQSEVKIDLPPNATVIDLRRALFNRWPDLGTIWSAAMIAVDEEYAPNDAPITTGSQLAVIPPVSGGAPDPHAPGIAP